MPTKNKNNESKGHQKKKSITTLLLCELEKEGDQIFLVHTKDRHIYNTWYRLVDKGEVKGKIKASLRYIIDPRTLQTVKGYAVIRI